MHVCLVVALQDKLDHVHSAEPCSIVEGCNSALRVPEPGTGHGLAKRGPGYKSTFEQPLYDMKVAVAGGDAEW
jgi:hypothetical protein